MKNNFKKICTVQDSINLLTGKWKLPILHALHKGSPKRFKALEREIEGITPTMLTKQLRDLEKNGMVSRKIFATVPPTVEYSLTTHGKTIKPVITELTKWGIKHIRQSEKKKSWE